MTKNVFLIIFGLDFRILRIENCLYTDFQQCFYKKGGSYIQSKSVALKKVNIEINQVKVRKYSCYKGTNKIQTHRSRSRKEFDA